MNPSVAVRFGLILEAYCHGTINLMPSLVKQVKAIDMLYRVATAAKNVRTTTRGTCTRITVNFRA